jgi:hypothetical protein
MALVSAVRELEKRQYLSRFVSPRGLLSLRMRRLGCRALGSDPIDGSRAATQSGSRGRLRRASVARLTRVRRSLAREASVSPLSGRSFSGPPALMAVLTSPPTPLWRAASKEERETDGVWSTTLPLLVSDGTPRLGLSPLLPFAATALRRS